MSAKSLRCADSVRQTICAHSLYVIKIEPVILSIAKNLYLFSQYQILNINYLFEYNIPIDIVNTK